MFKPIYFTDVNPISKSDKVKIKEKINSIIQKKDFILGKAVNSFERKFSKLSKIKYSVGCASGTDALLLALKSLNLRIDDEVIVPGMTYISTGLSVILNNNKLILADIDKNTGLISIKDLKSKINKNTKAIIPVNLYGQKVDLLKLRKAIGKKIFIIEDSAQSHFAYSCSCKIPNNKCCNNNKNEKYADVSCYSFYPAKNLGAYGDGGMISTNNSKLYKKILALRNLGSVKKNEHKLIGLNSRLDTIQSVILEYKLKSILKLNNMRRDLAYIYDNGLRKIKEIKLTKTNPGSSRHLYVIRTKKRNRLIKYLSSKKIFCQVHFPYSLYKIKPFKRFLNKYSNLKNSNSWANECLSLPLHPNLKNSEVTRIIFEIKKYFSN